MSHRFVFSTLLATLFVVSLQGSCTQAKEGNAKGEKKAESKPMEGFVPLFNGKDLDGWVKRGGDADYQVEGDMIVGTTKANTPNTFLCTARDYANFILEVELKADLRLNSGIQIRSECFPEAKTISFKDSEGKMATAKVPANRVHGYQVEIDHRQQRGWSGGIYDEARRGWLNDLDGDKNEAARKAYKFGEWNKYRIQANGDSIKTWVNGVPVADLTDDMTAKGFIALQVHGIYAPDEVGLQVRWRNIMIKELP